MINIFSWKRLIFLFGILAFSVFAISVTTLTLLYKKDIQTSYNNLLDELAIQRTMISTLYQQKKSEEEIVELMGKMSNKYYRFGQMGEFTLGHRVGDTIEFLLISGRNQKLKLHYKSNRAKPMQLATRGNSGVIKALDYRGKQVFAAYTYIPEINCGIVAKIDVKKVITPYFYFGVFTMVAVTLLITFCLFLFKRITDPLLLRIKEDTIELKKQLDENKSLNEEYSALNEELISTNEELVESNLNIETKNKELAHLLNKLKEAQHFSKSGNWEIDLGTEEVWWSEEVYRIFDLSPDCYKPYIKSIEDLIHSNYIENFNKAFHASCQNRVPFLFECKTIIQDDIIKHIQFQGKFTYNQKNEPVSFLGTISDITEQKRTEEALEKRIVSLTRPLGNPKDISFEEMFNLDELQHLQDEFANATGVASIITRVDGTPITKPSNFTRFCSQLVRCSIKGRENCFKSDAFIGRQNLNGPIVQPCLSGGLWDGGASIVIGGHHVANWLIGQVRNELQNADNIKKYAAEIGVDEEELVSAYYEVPEMSLKRFESIAKSLFTFSQQVSLQAYQNIQQSRYITEIKKNEDRLRKWEEIFRYAKWGISISSHQSRVYELINPEFAYMHGYTVTELIGQPVDVLLSDDSKNTIEYNIKTAHQKGHYSWETVNRRKDGSTFPALVDLTEVTDTSGKILYGVINVVDITNQKQINNELLLAKEKAEESDKLKTAFLQNMSHEIRTPMNAIVGFSELLLEYHEDPDQLKEFTQIIIQRSNDLLQLINEILDLSRIEAGQTLVNPEPVQLNLVFNELEGIVNAIKKRNGKLNVGFSIEVKNIPKEETIVIDKTKLHQILINLIGNAYKFTKEGYVLLSVMPGEKNNLIFCVKDTGIGIPSDKKDFVFGRFAQVSPDISRLYGGTGLGLSIVKGLVQLLGGKIWVESKLGEGSSFFFTIPYVKGKIKPSGDAIIDYKDYLKNLKGTILIVEDDKFNADYLQEILKFPNVNVLHHTHGCDAVNVAINQDIELVLMDIRLPDIDGFEATRQIKKVKPGCKIIAQTAYASAYDKQKAMDAGCSDYISKPINREVLFQMIRNLMQ